MDSSRKPWECFSVDELRRLLAADFDRGLTQEEVLRRRSIYGENKLTEAKRKTLLDTVVAQFKNPLTLILLLAGIVTLLLHEYVEAIVISVSLTINVVMGALQEERASKAFEKLSSSQTRHALVVREGVKAQVLIEELVPGDLVILAGGSFVPADVRLLEVKDFQVSEAALTGEWLPVSKSVEPRMVDTPLAERSNMAWMGTLIESGAGKGIVVATGNKTELGLIAHSLTSIEDQATPLQNNIRRLARFLTRFVGCALIVIFVVGLIHGEPLSEMFLIAVAVAVSTVPSGLPAALTVVLAVGMETVLKRGGLVRNLLAAETLGATTVILTDKTGTLTEARMKLTGLYSAVGVRDSRTDPMGDNRFILELAALASDAFIEEGSDPANLVIHGRPIEKATFLAALEAGISQEALLAESPRLDFLAFSSARRFALSLHKHPRKHAHRLIITGVPELLLERARFVRHEGARVALTEHQRTILAGALEESMAKGKRMIAVAYRDTSFAAIQDNQKDAHVLEELVLAGFMAFEDPVRSDVRDAIEEVKQAGAQVIMLTGDNPITARAIGERVGIVSPGDELVVRGDELEEWSDEELVRKLASVRVIARAVPAHKLRIARLLRDKGEVVAMTGDGINDAPALRAASIGIAVGSGTEVAKEASDLVLIENSFAVIVAAIEEGRRIIDNMKKIVAYLLSTCFSEIFVIGAAVIGGAPLPLLPTQILWGNVVEEGLMSFSFAFEPRDKNAMKRDPRSAVSKDLFTRQLRHLIFIVSVTTGTLLVALFYGLLSLGLPIEEIRTVMFVALSLDAIFFTFSLKSLDTPLWRINLLSNKYLLVAFGVSICLLFSALLVPPLRELLSLTPLTPFEKLLLVGVGAFNLAFIECMKYVLFMRTRERA